MHIHGSLCCIISAVSDLTARAKMKKNKNKKYFLRLHRLPLNCDTSSVPSQTDYNSCLSFHLLVQRSKISWRCLLDLSGACIQAWSYTVLSRFPGICGRLSESCILLLSFLLPRLFGLSTAYPDHHPLPQLDSIYL